MHALLDGRTGNKRHEAPPTKDGTHEGVVELPPVEVDGVRRRGQKHPQAGWAGHVAAQIGFRVLPIVEKRDVEGFGGCGFGGERSAQVL